MNDDFLSAMSRMRGGSDYTLEEIELAEKRMKKKGGTLQENLEIVTGKKPSPPQSTFTDFVGSQLAGLKDLAGQLASRQEMPKAPGAQDPVSAAAKQNMSKTAAAETAGREPAAEAAKHIMSADEAVSAMNAQLAKNHEELERELRELNKNLAEEKNFGIGEKAAADLAETAAEEKKKEDALLEGENALDAFAGLTDALEQKVVGQKEFLKKLVIAFKRPYVMPPEGVKARNAILLSGRDDTGKHYALCELAKELQQRRLIRTSEIQTIDLGIYTDASMEKLFMQDIYMALASDSVILLFEHFENCHPSFLTHISSLVTAGSFRLSERYILQKGQLVNVQTSLASEAVSAFEAKGKYLVFVTEKPLDKTAGIMGAPFVDALGDICCTGELDQDAIHTLAKRELEELKQKAADQCFFQLQFAEGFLEYSVSRSERQAGLKGVQDFYDTVLQALAQARLEGDYAKGTELTLAVTDGKLSARKGEETIDLSALLPESYHGEVDEIRREMDAIVGLAKVKEYVLSLEEYYKVQQRRAEQGLKTGEVSKHMIFTGSPGTGKTTIARIISKYLKAIGVLTGGQLVEVSRADLVGRYVGHTAPLTNKVIQSAIGDVLFIDEAYSLYRGKDDTFGLEAIDTLVKGIEDNRENLIVILAGYSIEMQEFLTSNSGLKSRFPNVINFPDYTGEELLKIARSIAKSKGYSIDEGADEALCRYFDEVQATRAADAGNGRLARNLVEEAILNQSKRLVAEPEAELSLLLLADFELEK
ncbi:MAG: AAA family ATPase [Lachnospiraceae bacterium]|nr:AAA family ATPase [Lachnospiraceae bacterium]